MLQIGNQTSANAAALMVPEGSAESEVVDVPGILAFLKRNLRTCALFTLFGLAAGGLVLTLVPPRYSARTTMLLDMRKPRSVQDQAAIPKNVSDLGYVESQVLVLESTLIIARTVASLALADDPEFNGTRGIRGEIARHCPEALRVVCPRPAPNDVNARTQAAIESVREALVVQRMGQSQVIELTFTAGDKDRAAEIANAHVRSYRDAEAATAARMTREAITWLEERIDALRRQALEADSRLQEFKSGASGPTDARQRAFALRELVSAAESQQALYQGFVNRYAETAQQASFPFSDMRILTEATPPSRRAGPSSTALLASAGLGSLVLGLLWAAMREKLARTIHTPDQLERSAGLPCLAAFPAIPALGKPRLWRVRKADGESARLCARGRRHDPLAEVLTVPDSSFARAIGLLLARLETRPRVVCTAVIGFAPVENSTDHLVIAANLARLAARLGRRTLLIDADGREATVSKFLAPDAVSSDMKPDSLEDALYRDEETGMCFLPARPRADAKAGTGAADPTWISCMISEARHEFALVIVALPRWLEAGEVHHAIESLDELVLIGKAGRVQSDQICHTFRSIRGNEDRVTGLILSSASLGRAPGRS